MNYALRDFEIIPSRLSTIKHREDIKVTYSNGMSPVFVSPMSCITNDVNYKFFENAGLTPIIPRNISFINRLALMECFIWIAIGLDEVDDVANYIKGRTNKFKVCIDVASGNMTAVLTTVDRLKSINPNIIIMTGNIANEYTYYEYAMHGVDYVRCGIGGGSVCTTTCGSGVHKAMGSLIKDVYECKLAVEADIDSKSTSYKSVPKIIADGGINDYDKINIALALGADYVMIGEMAAKTEEACGKTQLINAPRDIDDIDEDELGAVYDNWPKSRCYYGMSTQMAQREYNHNKPLKHSEGTFKWVPVEYSAARLVAEINHWLREAMSMCDCHNLEEYIGRVRVELHSHTEFESYNKPLMNI